MEEVETPFVVNLFYWCGANGEARIKDTSTYPVDSTTPRIERLRFTSISARNAQFAAGVFHGLPEMPLRDIIMQDIDVHMDPEANKGQTAMAVTVPDMCKRAFFARHVDGMRMNSVWVDGFEGPFMDSEFCNNMDLEDKSNGY